MISAIGNYDKILMILIESDKINKILEYILQYIEIGLTFNHIQRSQKTSLTVKDTKISQELPNLTVQLETLIKIFENY